MSEPQITPESATKMAQQLVGEGIQSFSSVGGLEQKAVEAWQAGQGERALQMLAGEVCSYTEEDVIYVLLENLSSEDRDPQTGKKVEPKNNTPEKERYNKALEISQACRDYLEKGGENPPKALIDSVVDYISQSPLFKDLLFDNNGQLKKGDAEAIAINLLRQQKIRQVLHRLFTERLDPRKRLEGEKTVANLKQELVFLSKEVVLESEDEIVNQISQKQKDIVNKQNDLRIDPYYTDYLTLKSKLRQYTFAISEIEKGLNPASNKNEWNARIIPLVSSNANIARNNREQVLAELIRLKNETELQLETKHEYDGIRKIEAEIDSLDQEIKMLEEKRKKASSSENIELKKRYFEKQQEFQEAKALLTAERIKYASEIIAIPKEAVKQYLDEALAGASQHYKEEAKKQAKEEEEKNRRLLESAIEKLGGRLGRKEKTKGGETRFIPDKKEAWQLLVKLMQPAGVEKFFEKIAENKSILTGYGLTDEEADLILSKKNDPEFVKKTGIELAKKVLADYLLAGGRLSREDIIALGNTDWVKSLIDDGLKIAKEKRQQIESLVGKDVLTRLDEIKGGKTTGEWLRGNWWKFGLGIIVILILLGIITLKSKSG